MTLEEINDLSLNEVFEVILRRVDSTTPYILHDDDLKSPYANLEMDPMPDFNLLEEEFVVYKQELLDTENERLRKVDIVQRWEAMTRNVSTLRSLHDIPNPAAWLRDLLLNEDHTFVEDFLVEIETAHPSVDAAETFQEEIALNIQQGADSQNLCNSILALVGGHNIAANLTTEEIQAFIVSFTTIQTLLKNNMPTTAKPLIEVVVGYDTLKAKILALYASVGL